MGLGPAGSARPGRDWVQDGEATASTCTRERNRLGKPAPHPWRRGSGAACCQRAPPAGRPPSGTSASAQSSLPGPRQQRRRARSPHVARSTSAGLTVAPGTVSGWLALWAGWLGDRLRSLRWRRRWLMGLRASARQFSSVPVLCAHGTRAGHHEGVSRCRHAHRREPPLQTRSPALACSRADRQARLHVAARQWRLSGHLDCALVGCSRLRQSPATARPMEDPAERAPAGCMGEG